jgi:RNA polymerase sigma-70 factor (ECF subfamily)
MNQALTRQSILQQAKTGAAPAWERLTDLYRPLIADWAKRHTTVQQDAEDLAQEILLQIARYLPNFQHNGRPGAFRAWLRTLAVHCTSEFWSTRHHQQQGTGGSAMQAILQELQDPHCALTKSWEHEHDMCVMNRLLEQVAVEFEPESMTIFRRQALDGVKAEDVAAELGVSVASAYSTKSRVLKRLRQLSDGLLDWHS